MLKLGIVILIISAVVWLGAKYAEQIPEQTGNPLLAKAKQWALLVGAGGFVLALMGLFY